MDSRTALMLALTLSCALAVPTPLSTKTTRGLDYAKMWAEFKEKFEKSFDNDEETKRLEIFKNHVDFIEAENVKGHPYTLGINQFSDLTKEEFVARYLGFKKPEKAFGDVPNLGLHRWNGEVLPDSVDWTTKGSVTPVKNQGQCGSCWAFSTVGALEGANQIKGGKLVEISEQQFVDCAKNGDSGCNGGNIEAAFRWAEGSAICTEDSYPYEARDRSCRASGCSAAIEKGKVVGYKQVAKQPHVIDASEKDLMSAVAQQPVSIAVDAGGIMNYKSGVFSGNCGQSINHGVLLVGYGVDPRGGDYWKVKNSWGPTWGMSGYVLIKRGDPEKGGKCGILQDPSYPILSGSSSVVV